MDEEKNQEVVVSQELKQTPIEQMLMLAVSKDLDITKLEKLMALRSQYLAEQAKREYDEAMAAFQAECPVIEKTKAVKNKSGVTLYYYAPIDNVIDQTHELLGKNGLSYDFTTKKVGDGMEVTCTIKHRGGHREAYSLESGLATRTEIMSAQQQTAATMTFLKRHTLMNGLGITTGDEDLDGKDLEVETVGATAEQHAKIDELAMQCKLDKEYVEKRCKEIYGVTFSGINKNQADGLILMLTKKAAETK